MIHRVIVEPSAERGIRQAVRWIAENQSVDAARCFNALDEKIRTLKRLPRRCPLAAEDDKFPEEIRELLHGRRQQIYRVLFTIREDTVHVLYVRHGAQDEIEPR